MNMIILSTSLNPESKSRILAHVAAKYAEVESYSFEFVDLTEFALPLCDGGASFSDEQVTTLSTKIEQSGCILLAGPIYTYGIGAAAKNLIELTGRSWASKPVGILVAAGGSHSYMGPLSLANALMLDFRCPIIPKYVYAEKSAFEDGDLNSEVEKRIHELVKTTHHWGKVL